MNKYINVLTTFAATFCRGKRAKTHTEERNEEKVTKQERK
jgi:hypothetical protein